MDEYALPVGDERVDRVGIDNMDVNGVGMQAGRPEYRVGIKPQQRLDLRITQQAAFLEIAYGEGRILESEHTSERH